MINTGQKHNPNGIDKLISIIKDIMFWIKIVGKNTTKPISWEETMISW